MCVGSKSMIGERILFNESMRKAAIPKLVCQRRWGLLEKLMRLDSDTIIADKTRSNNEQQDQCSISEDLMIHFICRFQAPLYIVELFKEAYPKSLTTFDDVGRYPLHIACAWGSPLDSIKFLIDSYPIAARVQDFDGKCPIHHLCHTYKRNYQDTSCLPVIGSMMAIVEHLYAIASMSFILEDDEEKNAIERAVESEVDLGIVRVIQRKCSETWIQMKNCEPFH